MKHIETIKKDIRFIIQAIGPNGPLIEYDKPSKLYKMVQDNDQVFYCFTLLTMLYGSRSLPKQDLDHLTQYIFNRLHVAERMQVKKITSSYELNYRPMIEKSVLKCIRDLYSCILNHTIIEITYTRSSLETKSFPIAPLSITYDEGFFYCVAYKDIDAEQRPIRNYRIDRINKYKIKKSKFTKPLDGIHFFEAGKHSNYSFMMHTGDSIITATIKVKPFLSNYLKSKFPVHEFIRKDGEQEIYKVTVSNEESLLFWLFQQRTWAEVLSPQSLRDKMKAEIASLAQMYVGD
ncbi:putative DNA-binding transcriptional regulator YafY [Paenibacillus castaneae]|uniref:helix-turn-helix transcriptional regulator n=1 Tax=Paenibacillus castaneae TaxID=474957 RepID=UPI000C9A3A55|nr:WYL domain-containing protein [Paenibacillus castaneae]NIK78761.1 putative DNA-binding transcriptional regulator YafY [Paenibacillus castaneae]